MKKIPGFFSAITLLCAISCINKDVGPVNYVNPYIGTDRSVHFTREDNRGATFPGVLVPYGMVQIAPDAYIYSHKNIKYFSFLNRRSGWHSNGNFHIMPTTGNVSFPISKSDTGFSHENEITTPYYYSVLLDDYDIKAEFTATERTGFCRFTFPESKKSNILLSDISDVKINGNNQITGHTPGHYFSILFSKPFEVSRVSENGDNIASSESIMDINNLFVRFFTYEGEIVKAKIGFSTTSAEDAENNLENEVTGWDFEQVKSETKTNWNEQLGKIEIKGGTRQQREQFYTALYHTYFWPTVITDHGSDSTRYTGISPWDTYRCKQPLVTILDPGAHNDMIVSELDRYDQTGKLRKGNMLANHNIVVILDSYVKGIKDFDINKAYEAMRKNIKESPYSREDIAFYLEYGYVPSPIENNVSKTLEYAYNDWALAEFIKVTGKQHEYAADHNKLLKRAHYYQNLFNPSSRFFKAKTKGGVWTEGGYCEANEWTNSWYVKHDIQGLINLMGGPREFSQKLEKCFAEGHYIHDNEPQLHYAYLFNYVGEPWKTQKWVRKIVENDYTVDPGGYPGNEDIGALSSWYVLSSMGFYSVTPGKPFYAIGSPLFEEVLLHLDNGEKFTIKAKNVSKENKYIQTASFNGKPLNSPWIDHEDIVKGGTLVFQMGPEPNKEWGTDLKNVPVSMTKGTPDFIFSDLNLSSEKVLANEPLMVSALVRNNGNAPGSVEFKIKAENKVVNSEWIIVDPGEYKSVKSEIRLYESGLHEISINSLEPRTVEVMAVEPAFEFSNLKIPSPPLVFAGEKFEIAAMVKNIGSYSGSTEANLIIDDKEISSKEIVLGPGEKKEIIFTSSYFTNEFVKVSIADLKPKRLHIIDRQSAAIKSSLGYKHFNPLFIFNFDEGQGETIEDLSGSGNHGIVHGNVKWVDGLFGKAIQTNAWEGDYIEIPINKELDSKTNHRELTMMVWIYPKDESGFSDILTKGGLNNIQVKHGNTIINSYIGGWQRRQAYSQVPGNWNRQWNHVAAVSDGESQKIYVNGNLAGIKEYEFVNPRDATAHGDIPWYIGSHAGSNLRYFNGYIDEVRVYGKALTSEEINQILLFK